MSSIGDRINRFTGKTRYVVCRLFVHLTGDEVAPLLGLLNRVGRAAVESEGDLEVIGEGLVEICQALIEYNIYWQAAANEGDVFWKEGDAGDYFTQLFTDSAQRYLSQSGDLDADNRPEDPLALPVTQNLIVMITVALEGESPDLETDLADMGALETGLKTLIDLFYQQRLQAIQVHFSPARLGEELTSEQILVNFPELIPL
ncbi:MAG: DUF1517 domain-containing protein [Prochloraceae cyanobacterium]